MRVAVIGAGKMGGGIARGLAPTHEVAIGSRGPEVVFLTAPWTSADQTPAELGELTDKVIVDVTDPSVGGQLQPHEGSSNAEEIQRKLPGARVVKGWNTIFSPVVNSSPDFSGQAASVFLAGDDPQAKEIVAS